MPASITTRPKIDRPISAEEVAVIQAALERAATRSIAPDVIESVGRLHAIAKCGCGCESVDFAPHDPANPSSPIADGIGTTSEDEEVGLIVWGREDVITGLEVYALGGEGHKLPVPETIHGWDHQRPNQAMEPTTGRRTPKFPMTPTSQPAATRTLPSGGSSCSR